MKWHKKLAQTLALLAIVVGGAVAPIAGVMIPGIGSVAHAATASGKSGDVDWNLDNDGVLTLSSEGGTLANNNSQSTYYPWDKYVDYIYKIKIEGLVYTNTNAYNLFAYMWKCTEFVGLENLNVSKSTKLVRAFYDCESVRELDLSSWDVSKVSACEFMFAYCSNLNKINVTGWNLQTVQTCNVMFAYCYELQELDLSTWKNPDIRSENWMFKDTPKLWKLTLGPDFYLTPDTDYALPNPVIDTQFGGYTVFSEDWREVGTGKEHEPNGNIVSSTAMAADHNNSGKIDTYVWQGAIGKTLVDYTVDPSYTITIPATITISPSDKYGTGNVVLKAYPKLPYEESLIKISATSPLTNWHLKTEGDSTGVAYNFGTEANRSQLSSGGWLTFTVDGTATTDTVQIVYATLPVGSQFKYAGTYTDTVNYTIETSDPDAR